MKLNKKLSTSLILVCINNLVCSKHPLPSAANVLLANPAVDYPFERLALIQSPCSNLSSCKTLMARMQNKGKAIAILR